MAVLEVQRADASLEFDSGTDGYTLLVERARASLVALSKFDAKQVHARHVCAVLVSAPRVSGGNLVTTATVLAPTNGELGGALLFAGLMSLKQHSPEVFATAMRRLRDAGVIDPGA